MVFYSLCCFFCMRANSYFLLDNGYCVFYFNGCFMGWGIGYFGKINILRYRLFLIIKLFVLVLLWIVC